MICVYPADCKDFSNNGLGIVLPQSCSVTETLNGEWELTLIHPIDVDGKWTRLTEGCILRAPVPAAMTPQVGLVTQQYQTTVYDILIYKVSTQRDPLRLRSGPGTDYRILGKYAKETEIIVLDKSNSGWYEVTCPDGKHGYMSSEYLTYVRTDTGLNQSNVGFHNQIIQSRQLRDQPFRIYRVVPELDKVTVYARHVFYDLLDNMIKALKPSPDAVGASVVKSLSASCLSAHGFTFYSDLTSSAEDAEWENKNPVEAMLGEGGLVEKYGAELARDWFDVFLVQRVGNDSDVQIRERKNLTGISYDVDETDVVTRIMPTGQDADGNILYLPELYIDSPNIGAYVHPKWIHLSVSEAKEVTDGDEPRSREECFTLMRQAAQAEYDKGCDLPTVTLKVDFVNCADTEEYRQYAALSNIFLGDSVRVIARRIGVEVSMRNAVFHPQIGCDSILADNGKWFPLILRRKLFLHVLVIPFRVSDAQTLLRLVSLANQVLTGCFADVSPAQLIGAYPCNCLFAAVYMQILHLKWNVSTSAYLVAMMSIQNDAIPNDNRISASLCNQALFQLIMFSL